MRLDAYACGTASHKAWHVPEEVKLFVDRKSDA